MDFFERFNGKRHLLAAHRGARARRPENTLSALEAAVGHCDFVEFDVRLSRDLVPVVIHDPTLRRTSNVASVAEFAGRAPWPVHEFDLNELGRLDFGSWFSAQDPLRLNGLRQGDQEHPLFSQPLLTLDRALLLCREQQLPFNIEIKDMTDTPQDARAVAVVLDRVQAMDCGHLALVSAFKKDYLIQCARLAPHISTAILEDGGPRQIAISCLHNLGVCAYHAADSNACPALIERLSGAGVFVNVYTVNDRPRMQQLYDAGVTAIFSDCV